MEDSTDFEISDSENVADGITEEKHANPSTSREKADLQESEMYHGVMVKPLSSFGKFEIESNSQEWPGVSDRRSGEVHKDMETVSELYNQDLNMRSVALNYVIELQEDLRWGEMKDILYELYPRRVQARAFAALEKLTKLEASRIISGETLTFTHETILKPMNDIVCNDDTAKSINREIETMRGIAERAMQQAREALALAQKEIYGYNIYTFDEILSMEHYTRGHSPLRKTAIKKLQLYKIRYIEARIFAFQLEQSFVRYEKRTQWIHMTTSPIPPSDEADLLFAQLDRLSKLHDMPFRGTCEDKETPYSEQMEAFKVSLRVFGTGVLRDFDSLHNSEWFQAYDFWVTYERSGPQMCTTLFWDSFDKPPPDSSYFFVSTPDIREFPKSHYKIRVYIDFSRAGKPQRGPGYFFSVFEPYKFCLNCFESGHGQTSCPKRKRE